MELNKSSRYYEEDLRRRKQMSKIMKEKKPMEFSKWLLVQEAALIWIVTISFIVLSFYCVIKQYFGELPWLTALAGFPWTAYGVSQAFYYKKSEKENTKNGIKYESTMAEIVPPITRNKAQG